ncbi:hypothetical protein EON80_28905 [bacterium]|nr:MAG: hypothetical protein EON80_28905 [bacterium]
MRPTTAHTVIDLRSCINLQADYDSPEDVVVDPNLTTEQKRTLLASWASDTEAVKDCPYLRAPKALRRPAPISDILDALRAIDDVPFHPPGGKPYRMKSIARASG